MSKLKKMIIFLSIIISIIILLMVYITTLEQEVEENKNVIAQPNKENIIDCKAVTNPHKYLTAKSCVEKYLGYIYRGDKESVYRTLDSGYIQKFNITQENVLEFVGKIEAPVNLRIEDMYVIEKNERIEEYYILGTLILNQDETEEFVEIEMEKVKYTVILDSENMIYSIIPKGYGGPFYEE